MHSFILIQKMLAQIPNNKSVDTDVFDSFLESNNIKIREEHRNLLIKYGKSKKLLSSGFSNLTFDNFREHYLDKNLPHEDRLPEGTAYVGIDLADEYICIDDYTGVIHLYYEGIKGLVYYINLDSLIFFYLMKSDYI